MYLYSIPAHTRQHEFVTLEAETRRVRRALGQSRRIPDHCGAASASDIIWTPPNRPLNGMNDPERYSHKWTLDYPELGTGPVSTDAFTSEAYFERERDAVFRRCWLNVGRVEDIPEPGDYIAKDLAVCNASVIVVRGHDGALRAFHNVCRHRAGKLAWGEQGSCQSFKCKNHGWTYGIDGKLKFVPDEDRFYDVDKDANGLIAVHVDDWNGFIFINLMPEPAQSLREYLGEIGDRLDDYPFAEMSEIYSHRCVLNANWKTGMYAFNEVYHLTFVHPKTGGTLITGKENHFGRPVWVELGERHETLSTYNNPDHKPSAVEELSYKYGPSFSEGARACPGVNPSDEELWSLDINVCFPNFFVDVFSGSYFTYNFWPLSHRTTLFEYRNYYRPAENAAHRFTNELSRVWMREFLIEDMEAIEQVQKGLETAVVNQIHLSDSEICVRHHLKTVDDHVDRVMSTTQGN